MFTRTTHTNVHEALVLKATFVRIMEIDNTQERRRALMEFRRFLQARIQKEEQRSGLWCLYYHITGPRWELQDREAYLEKQLAEVTKELALIKAELARTDNDSSDGEAEPDATPLLQSEHVDHRADVKEVERLPALSNMKYAILRELHKLKAFDPFTRVSTEEIATSMSRSQPAGSLKHPMTELVKGGFVETKTGSGGGCWLTPKGREEAERIVQPQFTP